MKGNAPPGAASRSTRVLSPRVRVTMALSPWKTTERFCAGAFGAALLSCVIENCRTVPSAPSSAR